MDARAYFEVKCVWKQYGNDCAKFLHQHGTPLIADHIPFPRRAQTLPNCIPSFVTTTYATALKACAATVRTAPVDSTGFVLLLTPAFWKNYLLRITFRATVNFSRYKIRLHGFCVGGLKPVLSC
jgi:hypothetical protein